MDYFINLILWYTLNDNYTVGLHSIHYDILCSIGFNQSLNLGDGQHAELRQSYILT